MSKIALFGYGKMGKAIERIALSRGHHICARINDGTETDPWEEADVIIDFSLPEVAFGNIEKGLKAGIPVISGTTGWLDRYEEALELCQQQKGAFLYASNFSLGVNLFFALNSYLAQLMGARKEYRAELSETHHIHKLDAPSGTAITLAEDLIKHTDYTGYSLVEEGKHPENTRDLPIIAYREGEVPGTHHLTYSSEVDQVELIHTAHNRDGFALGAVIAVEWIQGKSGVFTMKDVLNLPSS